MLLRLALRYGAHIRGKWSCSCSVLKNPCVHVTSTKLVCLAGWWTMVCGLQNSSAIVNPQKSKFLLYAFYFFLRSGNFFGSAQLFFAQTATLTAFSRCPRSLNLLKIETYKSLIDSLWRVELLGHLRNSKILKLWWKENHWPLVAL